MPGRVIVVGSVNTDIHVEVPRFAQVGETIVASRSRVTGGGKGANQAIAAARAGALTTIIAAIGDDPFSRERQAELIAAGVDTRFLRVVPGLGGLAIIEVDRAGANRIVVAPGANLALDAQQVEGALRSLALGPGDAVVVQLEVPLEAVSTALREAQRVGAVGILNASPWSEDAAPLLEWTSTLVVNRVEAHQMVGGLATTEASELATELARDVPVVIVTLGSEGALLVTARGRWRCVAPRVPVVDTTGAGDAFLGALAAMVVRGASWTDALQRAVWAGSLAVQRVGAQPSLPWGSEIDDALKRQPLRIEQW